MLVLAVFNLNSITVLYSALKLSRNVVFKHASFHSLLCTFWMSDPASSFLVIIAPPTAFPPQPENGQTFLPRAHSTHSHPPQSIFSRSNHKIRSFSLNYSCNLHSKTSKFQNGNIHNDPLTLYFFIFLRIIRVDLRVQKSFTDYFQSDSERVYWNYL